LQRVQDVTLIRHAYVRTASRGRGLGAMLLDELRRQTTGRVLVGTWADAQWAIRFYQRHGFRLVPGPIRIGCCGRIGKCRSGNGRCRSSSTAIPSSIRAAVAAAVHTPPPE
jgi:Acetyltransferases